MDPVVLFKFRMSEQVRLTETNIFVDISSQGSRYQLPAREDLHVWLDGNEKWGMVLHVDAGGAIGGHMEQVLVTLPKGLLIDERLNPSKKRIFTFRIRDLMPPQVMTRVPENGESNVATSVEFVFGFDEPIRLVADKFF